LAHALAEVDIVAQNIAGLHFIEVKYRQNHRYGSCFDYISCGKLQRLSRAALNWCQIHHYEGDYQIDAVSVSEVEERFTIALMENVS